MMRSIRFGVLVLSVAAGSLLFPIATPPASAQAAWNQLVPAGGSPGARFGHTAVVDSMGDRMVVFGGRSTVTSGIDYGDVWALALGGSGWSALAPTGAPPSGRYGHSAVYDISRGRMLIYGGASGNGFLALSDLWALDLSGSPAWTALPTGGTAVFARASHSAILDPVRDRMLVFGGLAAGSNLGGLHAANDLLAFDLAAGTWSTLTAVGTPPLPRWGHSALYDGARRRMLVFGGLGDNGAVVQDSSVWALSLDEPMTWTRLADPAAVAGLPGTCAFHGFVVDPSRQRIILQGGTPSSSRLATAPLAGGAWSNLSPSGGPPPGRERASTVVDAARQRMIVFGGMSADHVGLNDLWSLAMDHPTPALASLVDVTASAESVRLRWWAPGLDAAVAVVERATEETPETWVALGSARQGGASQLEFEDVAVEPGRRYGYRLVDVAAGGSTASAAEWVTIPGRLSLALLTGPNPAASAFYVSCDILAGGPARLEVLDVTGRVVRAVDLTDPGRSERTVRLRVDVGTSSGLYYLRLQQGPAQVVKRVSVVR